MIIMLESVVAGRQACNGTVAESLHPGPQPYGRKRETLGLTWTFDT